MTAATACRTCGTEPREGARFCDGCGAPVTPVTRSAEYKQVTVLFADVVHSMYIAAAVGAERLREIMAELARQHDRGREALRRHGGQVHRRRDHGGLRSASSVGGPCRAGVSGGIGNPGRTRTVWPCRFATVTASNWPCAIGLNSGQVIAGEVGSASLGYTTIGEQVGMAQRMESVAPPGGVMLSASTARLVDGAAVLSEPELARIKGADEPVAGLPPAGHGDQDRTVGRAESNLVGRRWEMSAVEGLLERAIDGHGAVVGVVGSPGIGKSRLVREVAAMAGPRGVEVFTAYCESHTTRDSLPCRGAAAACSHRRRGLDGPGRPRRRYGPGSRCRPRGLAALRRPAGHRRSRCRSTRQSIPMPGGGG